MRSRSGYGSGAMCWGVTPTGIVECISSASLESTIAWGDECLTRFAEVDPRASRVVELRFFSGLKEQEAADVLGISLATLKRDWTFAKAWLYQALAE